MVVIVCVIEVTCGLCCGGTKVVRCLGLVSLNVVLELVHGSGGGVKRLLLTIVPHIAGQRCALNFQLVQ